jgi:hypothetical protein
MTNFGGERFARVPNFQHRFQFANKEGPLGLSGGAVKCNFDPIFWIFSSETFYSFSVKYALWGRHWGFNAKKYNLEINLWELCFLSHHKKLVIYEGFFL